MKIALKIAAILIACGAVVGAPHSANAEGTRAPVRVGDVTGIDLNLDGNLSATRGHPWRAFATVYEVVGLRDLRPARGAHVRLTTSIAHSHAAELTTDDHGRILLQLDVPENAPQNVSVGLEVRHLGSILRRFDFPLSTQDRAQISFDFTPDQIPVVGAHTTTIVGRITDVITGTAIIDRNIALTFLDPRGSEIATHDTVRSDTAGFFHTVLTIPNDQPSVIIHAKTGTVLPGIEATKQIIFTQPLVRSELQIVPSKDVVAPGESDEIDFQVRNEFGLPVEHAAIHITGSEQWSTRELIYTDARGRARATWTAPSHIDAPFRDGYASATAVLPNGESPQSAARIRVAKTDWLPLYALEGGVIVPGLPSTFHVSPIDMHGQIATTHIRISSTHHAMSSHEAFSASFDGTLGTFDLPAFALDEPRTPTGDDTEHACDPTISVDLTIELGSGPRTSRQTICLPIDRDGTLVLHANKWRMERGQPLNVTIARAASVRTLPIIIRAYDERHALLETRVDANVNSVELAIPDDTTGLVHIVARPLYGTEELEIRGGSWVVDSQPKSAGQNALFELAVQFPARERSSFPAFRGVHNDPRFDEFATERAVTRDLDAPAVLRNGHIVAMPAPRDATTSHLLRDSWRARARFIEGRLGRVFGQIETRVDQAIPGSLRQVAAHTAHGWTFNSQILDAVASTDADEGARGLSGEPLTITQLASLDPEFTYDNVARRVTRHRLMKVLLSLREFVRSRDLDLPWAHMGDPATWLAAIANNVHEVQIANRSYDAVNDDQDIAPSDLFDAWGREFKLRPSRAGHPLFAAIVAVPGYDLVSAGPDGVYGNADDVVDPTAIVLTHDGVYAQAVNERALVAELHGVALGRAIASEIGSANGVPVDESDDTEENVVADSPITLPDEFENAHLGVPTLPLSPGPYEWLTDPNVQERVIRPTSVTDQFSTVTDRLEQQWGAVPHARTLMQHTGISLVGEALLVVPYRDERGASVVSDLAVPAFLRVGEALTIDATIANLDDTDSDISIGITSHGSIPMTAPEHIRIAGGASAPISLHVNANNVGRFAYTISIWSVRDSNSRAFQIHGFIDVLPASIPMRSEALGGAGTDNWHTTLAIPSDAKHVSGEVVVFAPNELVRDFALNDIWFEDPTVRLWAAALVHQDASLINLLTRHFNASQIVSPFVRRPMHVWPALEMACAIVALGSAAPENDAANTLRDVLSGRLSSGTQLADSDAAAGALRTNAAVLAALSTYAPPLPREGVNMNNRAIDQSIAAARASLRESYFQMRAEPTLLVRAAAALLLADERDGHGRAMYELARTALIHHGDRVEFAPRLTHTRGDADAVASLFALAVAAHQMNDLDTQHAAARSALALLTSPRELRDEALFWYVASGVYGALGAATNDAAIRIDGEAHTVAFDHGVMHIAMPDLQEGSTHSISINGHEDDGYVVRVTGMYDRAIHESNRAPVSLAIAGDIGKEHTTAALTLLVTPTSDVPDLEMDITLPAASGDDDALISALRANASVASAEIRTRHVVHIRLNALSPSKPTQIMLPLRWIARGDTVGLGVVAYQTSHPDQTTTLTERHLVVGGGN